MSHQESRGKERTEDVVFLLFHHPVLLLCPDVVTRGTGHGLQAQLVCEEEDV